MGLRPFRAGCRFSREPTPEKPLTDLTLDALFASASRIPNLVYCWPERRLIH
jgi:hypothetical protein